MKNIGAEKQLSEYNHVYKENTAIYRDLSIRLGLNESTFWILYTLRIEEPPVTQSDMCAILAYPKQTVNSALKKLEQEGLLTLFGERGRSCHRERAKSTARFFRRGAGAAPNPHAPLQRSAFPAFWRHRQGEKP